MQSEDIQVYNKNTPINNILFGQNINQDEFNINKKENNERLNTEITKKKKKKKIKIKQKGSILSSFSRNNEMTNKNLEEEQLKKQDEINIYNNKKDLNMFGIASEAKFVNKEAKTNNNENRRIIDRIKINCCCIYFWFCFSRKKKNIQNILMDEGMDIIVENLDIMNVFKKIYSIRAIEESFKSNVHILDMSDNCKFKLHSLLSKESNVNND